MSFVASAWFPDSEDVEILTNLVPDNEENDGKDSFFSSSDHSSSFEAFHNNFSKTEDPELLNEYSLHPETFALIDSNKHHTNTSLAMTLRDQCIIPVQLNRNLPIRPTPLTPVRNRSAPRILKDNKSEITCSSIKPDIYEIDCKAKENDTNKTNKTFAEKNCLDMCGNKLHEEVSNLNEKNNIDLSSNVDNAANNDEIKISGTFKRKFGNCENENMIKCFKKNYPKHELIEKNVSEIQNPLIDTDDVMCIKSIDSHMCVEKNEFPITTSTKINLDTEKVKIVPPLRLKKVAQKVTIDQQKYVTNEKHFSEVETSNYRIVTGATPAPIDSTEVIVSTTLTSSTTSLMPTNYIDNIRITIPSMPELGIQEYEITGPNFIATMTSKITGTSTHSSKIWKKPSVQKPLIWNTEKRQEQNIKSPNRSSNEVVQHNIVVPNSSPQIVVTKTDNVKSTRNNENEFYESMNLSRGFSMPLLTESDDDEVKLDQVITNVSNNSQNQFVESVKVKSNIRVRNSHTDETETVIQTNSETINDTSDDKDNLPIYNNNLFSMDFSEKIESLNNQQTHQDRDENKLNYRRNKLKQKLEELRVKAIDLQRRMASSCILAADSPRRTRFRQTINCYEKQIENLSKLLNTLSSKHDDNSVIDDEKEIIEDNQNKIEKLIEIHRSPSLSPPKLLPSSPINYSRIKSPSEIRNSPPILPKICVTIPDDVEMYRNQKILKHKSSLILEQSSNCEKYCNESNENGRSNSPFFDTIHIKDSKILQTYPPRQRIEIHDDECVELTLFMKPMNKISTTQDSKNVIENCTTYNGTKESLDSKDLQESKNIIAEKLITEKNGAICESSIISLTKPDMVDVQIKVSQDEEESRIISAFLIDEKISMPLIKQPDSAKLNIANNKIYSDSPKEGMSLTIFNVSEDSPGEILMDENQVSDKILNTPDSIDLTVENKSNDDEDKIAQTANFVTSTMKKIKKLKIKKNSNNESISPLHAFTENNSSVVNSNNLGEKQPSTINADNTMYTVNTVSFRPVSSEYQNTFLPNVNDSRISKIPISSSLAGTVQHSNPSSIISYEEAQSDTDLRPKYPVTSMTSMPLIYSTSPIQTKIPYLQNINHSTHVHNAEANGKHKNDSQVINQKESSQPFIKNNNTTRAVYQNKSNSTQQSQSPTINSNMSPNQNNITERSNPNNPNHQILSQQFPTFGNWAAQFTNKDPLRNKKRSVVEHKNNVKNQQNTMRIPEPDAYKISAPNVEVPRNNYIAGNLTYIPRWNNERPQERQPLLQHVEPLSVQTSLPPIRQGFFTNPSMPRYTNDYTVDPYAGAVFGYHTTYPCSSTIPSYPAVQSISNLDIHRTPLGLKNPSYPPISSQSDKRLSSISGFRNIADLIRIPNPLMPSNNIDRHNNLSAEYLRASTYNNCSILMDPQYARPIYQEGNVSQYGITKIESAAAFGVDQSYYKKPVDDLLTQSRYLRDQQLFANTRSRNFQSSINGQDERTYVRPVNHEYGSISSNAALTSSALTSIAPSHNTFNAPSSYSVPSNRIPLPLKELAMVIGSCETPLTSRTCETPNLGKVIRSPNSAQKLRCFNCNAMNSMFQCLGCEAAFYCNEICQTRHWNFHVTKCPKIMPKLKKVS